MARTLLIKNGTVIDGTGAKGRHADILVVDDRIARIGKNLRETADAILDASDRVVTPGFIDTHSHADGGLLDSPTAETQIRQGITTGVIGQDGGSHLPLTEWFPQVIKREVALNLASFVGHSALRDEVLGKDSKRKATPDEIRKMRALVAQEMKAGALGLSTGLEYDPGLYAETTEVVALAEVAGIYNGIYISHVRDEEDEAFTSFHELIRIAREGRLPAQISHIKLASSPVWGKTAEVFRLMEQARLQGVEITADVYPYTYWQSTIIVLIPTREWENRSLWEKGLAEVGGAKNVLLTAYEPDPTWVGKTIAEIATRAGKDAVTVIQEIVRKTHGEEKMAESVVVTAMQETDVKAFIAHPRIMFCTDGGVKGSHPRRAGSFPRVLAKYVREERVLPLEEAIRKMTSLPAWRMGFRDRGHIAVGKKADLVIFDPRTVRDMATTREPQAKPIGIDDVLVNGVPVVREGRVTEFRPGQIIRRSV